MTKLKDVVPQEFLDSYDDVPAYKFLDVEVIADYGYGSDCVWKQWPGTHKNVVHWWVLANGKAVAWNENVSVGWSFPVIKFTKDN